MRLTSGPLRQTNFMTQSLNQAKDHSAVTYRVIETPELLERADALRPFLSEFGHTAMYCDPGTLNAVSDGMRQKAYLIEARSGDAILGVLPLVFLNTLLFGRVVASLPYFSWAGAMAHDADVRRGLVDQAVKLTDDLDAKYLELRQLQAVDHPALVEGQTDKVLLRVPLSDDPDVNWKKLKSEVRTQVRKATKNGLEMVWGREELLDEFYTIFARNMRDLGTPVYSRKLFANFLEMDRERSEIGIVRLEGTAIAGCLALHGPELTEIPTAAALREYRKTAANSFMYWHAIERSIGLGQKVFDFGRSTPGSPTYVFKRKWGAEAERIVWQYYLRKGDTQSMRPDNKKFDLAIKVWQRLPVTATRVLGPMIVRGIP